MNKVLLAILVAAAVALLLLQVSPVHPVKPGCTCGGTLTKIHAIQGTGETSPLVNKQVSVSAVVVGDFPGLNGFFIEEEDSDADANPATSEGLFVYDPAAADDVKIGDRVCITGTVSEYIGMTELRNVIQVKECGRAPLPTPVTITLPLSAPDALEQVEGMRVVFPQALTVTGDYALGRYGEVTLSNGRLFTPTEVAAPGGTAQVVQTRNVRNRIVLDDGSVVENPDPIIYPAPMLTATNTLRDGDTVSNLHGVIAYAYGSYLVEPTRTPTFVPTNPRPADPPPVGGTLRVASFNVENYFNGDGCGGGFPTARGARSLADFERQRDKLVKALVGLHADVIGLAEIENDGYGPGSALHNLVSGMNAAAPIGTSYNYVRFSGNQLGTDAITCAIVYRTQTVAPVGGAATDPQFPALNRPPLAQTFVQKGSGAKFTVVMNHFKSKLPRGASGADVDQGDGQGAWNHTRTEAAQDLVAWLATDPTGSKDPDVLILGDLNAYTHADPVTAITAAGYTDLVYKFNNPNYTYVYKGEAGCLDHALASSHLTGQVTGAAVWHIDADEPPVLGYKTMYKSADQITSLYRNDPYRSSDHDPIVIGLNLK